MVRLVRQASVEVAVRILIAGVIAVLGAAVWMTLAGGPFVPRFGWVLGMVGMVMAMPPVGAFTRVAMVTPNAWLGRGPDVPERDLDYGNIGFTRFGVLLFVSLPLLAVGVWLGG
jgi:hypothetical protein